MSRRDQVPRLTMTAWLRFDEIRRALSATRPRSVIEFGAGQGGLGAWIARSHAYVGVEPDAASRAVAVERVAAHHGASVVDGLGSVAVRDFDLACAFEVLEHIGDDAAALDEWRDLIAPRGFLLLSVPAHSDRYGVSDEYVGHFRRYDAPALRELLEAHGFSVVRARSYGAGLGQVLEAARNVVLRRRKRAPDRAEGTAMSGRLFQPGRGVAALANYLVVAPFRVLQLPFARTDVGTGYVVLAQRDS